MHLKLNENYSQKVLPNIEEPIREIVLALWELPFVVDTNEACCGHIVTSDFRKRYAKYKPIKRGLYWYPHGIRLGIDFSLEDGLQKKAELFREDIFNIVTDIGLRSNEFERAYQPIEGSRTRVLHVWYDSAFPGRDFEPPHEGINDCISIAQNRLINFWESFAQVVKKYNSQATISPISGKNFLEIIN